MKEFFQKFSAEINAEHRFQNELPILQSPLDFRDEAVAFSDKDQFSVLYWKDYEHLADPIKQKLTLAMREICFLSDQSRRHFLEENFYTDFLTPFNSDNSYLYGQRGLFTASDIKAFSPVGPYSGRYLESEKWLEAEYSLYPQLLSARYTHACDPVGFPCVSAFQSGNFVSVINDWRPDHYQSFTEADFLTERQARQNVSSVIVQCGAARAPFFFTVKDIPAHQQLFTDYGENYWRREALYEEWTNNHAESLGKQE